MEPRYLYTIKWSQPYATDWQRPYIRGLQEQLESIIESKLEDDLSYVEASTIIERIMKL